MALRSFDHWYKLLFHVFFNFMEGWTGTMVFDVFMQWFIELVSFLILGTKYPAPTSTRRGLILLLVLDFQSMIDWLQGFKCHDEWAWQKKGIHSITSGRQSKGIIPETVGGGNMDRPQSHGFGAHLDTSKYMPLPWPLCGSQRQWS